MESGGGGGGAGFVAGRSSDEEPTPTPTSTSTLLGRMRLALSRRTSSASKPGGSNKQTPLGSRRGSAISEPEPEVDFLGTSVRAKKASSSTSMTTTTTTTNNPNAGLSLSQLFAEKRPFDPSVPLSETGRGSRPGDGAIEFGFSLSRGRRLVMEDFHAARFETHPSVPGKDTVGTFGVFDGHGGDRAAAFVSRELFRSILSSEEFASGDAAGALTAGFLATDRAYLLAEDEESLAAAAAAAEEEEAARKKKVFGKVKSIFNKSRNISGEMTANGSGSGNNDFGLSPPPASSMMAATLSGAPSSSSMSSGEGSGHGRGGTGAGTGGGIKINGRGGGLTTTTTTTRSSSAASPPLTPTEGDLARSTSGTGGTGGAGAGAGAGTGGNSSPSPFPLTPSPSRQRPPARDDGCTAAVALVLGDERLLVAHVGDSRAVLVEPVAAGAAAPEAGKTKKREGSWRGGKKNEASSTPPPPPLPPTSSPPPPLPPFTARALSADHKPNRPDERARIEAAGGAVLWAGTWRVGGVLAVSRAFGDSALKLTSGVVAEPDVHEERLNLSSTSFSSASSSFAPLLILATDGVWDALGNDEAAAVALAHAGDLEAAARALTREAWERGSPDNATAVVVRLGPKGAATSEAAAA